MRHSARGSTCRQTSGGLSRVSGWLLGLAIVLAFSAPGAAAAGKPPISITSVIQLDTRTASIPSKDADLLALIKSAGKALSSLEAADYAPFQSQWIVLQLSRPDPASRPDYFRINSFQRREIDAFLLVDGQLVARAAGGYARVSAFDAVESQDFKLPLENWTGTEATLLLRCVTTERLPYLAGFFDAKAAPRQAAIATAFLFFFIGCSLVFISFQLMIFLGLRERASRDYALFVGLIALVHLIRTGCLSWDFWPGANSAYPGDVLFILRVGVLISSLRMIDSFFTLERWNAQLRMWNHRMQLAVVVTSLIAVCFGQSILQATIALWHVPVCVWGVTIATRAAAVGRPGALLLLIAWSGLAAAATYTNLVIAGWLSPSFFLPFAAPAGILWEMAFNGTGLVIRLEVLRQQRHEAQVRKVENRELARLVQIVCHDISNPLMVVRFAHERIKQKIQTGEAPASLAEPVLQAAQGEQAIKGIIDDVHALELLRTSGGALPLDQADVSALTREALAMFRERAAAKGVQLEDQLPAGTTLAFVAPGILVRNVLSNLLSNAVKFTPIGMRVQVALERQPGQLGIRITDNGAGIPPETILALERAEPLTSQIGTAGERGTGFGLRITRDFVVAMGGTLHFAAPKPGAGTTVTIWLREA